MSRLSLQIVEQGSGEVLLEAQPNGNFLKFGNEQRISPRALKRAEKSEIRQLIQQVRRALSEPKAPGTRLHTLHNRCEREYACVLAAQGAHEKCFYYLESGA